jgi:ubiquinone/menaquinone biosynthesis C-methylase UbiE
MNNYSSQKIFDKSALVMHRNRASKNIEQYDNLIEQISQNLIERLNEVNMNFQTVLDLGCNTGQLTRMVKSSLNPNILISADISEQMLKKFSGNKVVADEEIIPFKNKSFNLVLSTFALNYVNQLPKVLKQILACLKPNGLFIGTVFGEKTLTELKLSILESEIKIKGGASPRIMPMFNIRDIGNLLQQIGYNLTVVDSDLITYQYENFMDLVRALRGMGITNILSKRDKNYLGKKTLEEMGKNYLKKFGNKQNKISATFEILYLTGWSPHYSQQKPLKPGSAEHSLSSILNSKK